MKTQGQFTIVIRGSTDRTMKVAISSWAGFDYLMHRLLTGEPVAQGEFAHYGIAVELGPAAVLSAAADFFRRRLPREARRRPPRNRRGRRAQ